jgi:PAS domain S-box-containing protein
MFMSSSPRKKTVSAQASTKMTPHPDTRPHSAILNHVLHTVPQAIFWKDRESVYLGCNAAFAKAAGLTTPDEIVGKTDFDLPWLRTESEAFRADDREVIQKDRLKSHIIETMRLKDGSTIWVDTTKVPLHDASGQVMGVLGIYEDITGRKQTEQELRDSQRMLQLVLDTIPVRVFWKDRDLTYLGCNRLFAADAGVSSPDEVIGQDDFKMGWREQAELYRADDRRVMESTEPKINYEEPQTTPDGKRIWLRTSKIPLRDERGATIGVLGTYEDITDNKRAEKTLGHRLAFEKLITDISSRFINLRPEEMDAAVNEALRDIGRFMDVDRSYVFLFREDGRSMDNTHEWCAEGIESHVARLKGLRVVDFPSVDGEIRRGQTAVVRVAELGPDRAVEKAEFEREGIQSLVLVPMYCRGQVLGFLGLDAVREARHFSDDSVSLLRIAGECLAGALDRRRYEETLRRERDILNRVMETSPVGITRLDRDGRITFANRRAEQVLGLTRSGISSRTYGDPDGRITTYEGQPFPETDLPFPRVMTTGQTVHDVRYAIERPDGQRVLLSINASPLRNESGAFDGMVATIEDVTEKVRAEQALRDENAFRMAIIDRAAEGLCVCHETPEVPNIRFTVWNSRMTEITGYTIEEINERGWYQALYPDPEVRERAAQRMARMRTGEDILGEEWEITHKDGAKRTLAISTTIIPGPAGTQHVLALMHDLTERKRAEDALRESSEFSRQVVTSAQEGIVVCDRKLRYIVWNQYMERITGKATGEVIGKQPWEALPFLAELGIQADLERALAGETVHSPESRIPDGNGTISKWMSTIHSPLRNAQGEIIGVIGIIRDITERKRAEEERRHLEAQMQHVQKLESLGVLAGGIAHDFNNLLMAILGNADLAMRSLSHVSPAQGYLRDIETASRRAADLCRQMLAYSGKGRFVIETLNMNEVVEEMTRMLEVSISKKAVLKYHLAANLPAIAADATQVRQVLMNLIMNASEAIGERSGIISIATGAIRCDRSYLGETHLSDDLAEGMYIYIEVADTGSGMTPEVRSKIFDPFFTTKFTGRGLGMAAVLGIVRGHKGAIKIYSELGRGTTIKVLFPAIEKTAVKSQAARATPQDWKGSGTILVVDDEETVRVVTERMLQLMGFQAIVANDGRDALEVFRKRHTEIACVLLDLTMPHMDGEEAYREMRRIDKNVRVVMSSGYNEQEVTQRFVGKGLVGFLQKPFQYEALQAKLREVLETRSDPATAG